MSDLISSLSRPLEVTFTIKDAAMERLREMVNDININDTPWFELFDKHGNDAKYYREPQWIPVSERLLEEKSDWKNVTILDESGDSTFTYVSVGYYLNNGMWIVDNEPMEEGNLIRVIAWMPLPEPYQKEGDSDV